MNAKLTVFLLCSQLVRNSVRPKTNRVQQHVQMRHLKMNELENQFTHSRHQKLKSKLLKSKHRKTFFRLKTFSAATAFLRSWWSQAGSNRRPPACKAGALPAELWPPDHFLKGSFFGNARRERLTFSLLNDGASNAESRKMVGLGRFELPTSPLSGVRSNQLSYRPKVSRCPNIG